MALQSPKYRRRIRRYFKWAYNDGGMVSWGLDTTNLPTSRNLIN